jgi:hypothetical protein
MGKLYLILLWLLVLLCGGCAIAEVWLGAGTFAGLFMIIAGLCIVAYIIRLPVEINND